MKIHFHAHGHEGFFFFLALFADAYVVYALKLPGGSGVRVSNVFDKKQSI